MNPHNIWVGKLEGPNFVSTYNQEDLKPGTLKISVLVEPGKWWETEPLPLERQHNKQAAVWKTPGEYGRESYLLILEPVPES